MGLVSNTYVYWQGWCTDRSLTYRIVPSKHPYPCKRPPPNFDVLWFFEVLHVTTHHAKFLCIESAELWMPRHQASKVRTHPSMASFAAFFPCSTKFAYCKWRLNAAETWQQGYESVSFVAWYSFLHCRAGLDEARSDDAVHPGSLLRIWGGPLHRVSWTIQAPSLCNRPPSIFGAWAASTHGRLLGTIRY